MPVWPFSPWKKLHVLTITASARAALEAHLKRGADIERTLNTITAILFTVIIKGGGEKVQNVHEVLLKGRCFLSVGKRITKHRRFASFRNRSIDYLNDLIWSTKVLDQNTRRRVNAQTTHIKQQNWGKKSFYVFRYIPVTQSILCKHAPIKLQWTRILRKIYLQFMILTYLWPWNKVKVIKAGMNC